MAKIKPKTMISKIMLTPARTVNLGDFNSVKLSAGVEIQFEKPVDIEGEEAKQAFADARKTIKEEFKKQFEPYYKKSKQKGGE